MTDHEISPGDDFMSRMLFLVPRMYTVSEFKRVASIIPDDFTAKTQEFWSYVAEKTRPYIGKIQRIYRDEVCVSGQEALEYLSSSDQESFSW